MTFKEFGTSQFVLKDTYEKFDEVDIFAMFKHMYHIPECVPLTKSFARLDTDYATPVDCTEEEATGFLLKAYWKVTWGELTDEEGISV